MGIYNFRNQKSVFKKKEKRNRRRNFKIIKKQKKSTSNVKLKKKKSLHAINVMFILSNMHFISTY